MTTEMIPLPDGSVVAVTYNQASMQQAILTPAQIQEVVITPAPIPPVPPTTFGIWSPNKAANNWRDSWASGQQALTGVVPGIAQVFRPWSLTPPVGASWGDWDQAWADDAHSLGCTPMITWEGRDLSRVGAASQPAFSHAAICRGDWDSTLITFLKKVGAWGKPLLLRTMHEGNGHWYPWAAGANGGTCGSYIDAYRHIVRLVRLYAPAVQLIWNVGVSGPDWLPLEDTYPGDAYVDWTSLDYYSGAPGDPLPYKEFSTIAPYLDRLEAVAPHKPIMVCETGCRILPNQDTPGWYTRMGAYLKTERRIRGVVFFDNISCSYDFRVSHDPGIYQKYKDMVKDPATQGRIG